MKRDRLRIWQAAWLMSAVAVLLFLSPSGVHAAGSGTTGMGYGWVDNRDGAPATTFDWVEIAAPPSVKLTPVSSCDDCVQHDVDIGFDFRFFGVPHRTVSIGANGSLMFGNTTTQWGPNEIPSTFFGSPVMLPFWSDWDPGSRGDVYAQPVDWAGANGQRAFAIEWSGVENWDCDRVAPATWEVILIADGSFVFQYKQAVLGHAFCDGGRDMTVAIQQGAVCFITYANQENVIADGTAIRWSPQQDACSGAGPAPTDTPAATRTPVATNTPDPSSTPVLVTPTVAPALVSAATSGGATLEAGRRPDPAPSTTPRDRLGNLGVGPRQRAPVSESVMLALLAAAAGALVVAGGGLPGGMRRWLARRRGSRLESASGELPRRPGGGRPWRRR